MITQRKAANAVSGKTARACESCLRKRARWYCGADDAFLCQSCDASVHSANPLASRHERVRLEAASLKFVAAGRQLGSGQNSFSPELPTWHHGFARKARTPRKHPNNKPKEREGEKKLNVPNSKALVNSIRLVPEMGGDEDASLDGEDEEQQLLYRVPIFDQFAAELCNASSNETDEAQTYLAESGGLDGFHLPEDDMELLEFAADVESLLGTGFNEEIEGLGLIDCKQEKGDNIGICFEGSNNNNSRVKVENEVLVESTSNILACDDHMETLDWDFGYESPVAMEEEKVAVGVGEMRANISDQEGKDQQGIRRSNTSILLRLNYEGVISAWANQGSPWTTGIRPEFNPDDCWPDFMGMYFGGNYNRGGGGCSSDGGREARVSRYREKRRTRLFSKKIRYEVRKLNAEKRPRMKGRFVKRTSFVAPAPAAAPTFPTNYTPLAQK